MTSTGALRDLPAEVARFSRVLQGAILAGDDIDTGMVNAALRQIAATDVSSACLAWRQASNCLRLAQSSSNDVARLMAAGAFVATAFRQGRTRAVSVRDGWWVAGQGLLTTGMAFASYVLVEATTETGTQLFLIERQAVEVTARPTFAGLEAADNAVISFEAFVQPERVIAMDGFTSAHIVELPYALGFTMGAVAMGAIDAMTPSLLADAEGSSAVGLLLAQSAAAGALVEDCSRRAPAGSWWSRAAKVAATSTAIDVAQHCITRDGARAYPADNPTRRLLADLEGLRWQAPAEPRVAQFLTETTESNTNTNRRTA